ncbi:MAG: MobC family plasmid mobilization relaxosome protein [Oscillospiraceae bacterium]|nr:MobC family plasmid mobilization relaxosome protein [Oscillospiraceae bacterium]
MVITVKQKKKESEKKRTRDQYITFRVTGQERDMIDRRMAQAGMKNRRAYLLKMAADGQIVRLELDSVKEMVRLLSNATNNINQIAHRANATGSIYAADLDELRGRYDEIWKQTKEILHKLAQI